MSSGGWISRMVRDEVEEAEAASSSLQLTLPLPLLPPLLLPLLLLRPPLDGFRDQPGRRLGRLGSRGSNDMARRAGGRPFEPSGAAGPCASPAGEAVLATVPSARDAAVVLERVRSRSNENTRRAACRPPPAAALPIAADDDPPRDVAVGSRKRSGLDVAPPDAAPPRGSPRTSAGPMCRRGVLAAMAVAAERNSSASDGGSNGRSLILHWWHI